MWTGRETSHGSRVPTTKESGFKTQLFSYFKNASTMNDFVYIFKFRNGGITLNGAKSKFQTLFQTTIKDKNGNDVNALWYWLKDNDNIKGNLGLLKSLFKDAGKDYDKDFGDDDKRNVFFVNNIINSPNSNLYGFIKIQSDL